MLALITTVEARDIDKQFRSIRQHKCSPSLPSCSNVEQLVLMCARNKD